MDDYQKSLISFVIPLFNEEECVEKLYSRIRKTAESIGMKFEIVCINDHSTDSTLQLLRKLRKEDPRVKIVSFSRNFGHQIAVTAGLRYASGDCVVVMDADLQDPPELVKEMIVKWQQGFDVVYGIRRTRKENLIRRLSYKIFYRILDKISFIPIPLDSREIFVDEGTRYLASVAVAEIEALRIPGAKLSHRECEIKKDSLRYWHNFVAVLYKRLKKKKTKSHREILKFIFEVKKAKNGRELKLSLRRKLSASLRSAMYHELGLVPNVVQNRLGYKLTHRRREYYLTNEPVLIRDIFKFFYGRYPIDNQELDEYIQKDKSSEDFLSVDDFPADIRTAIVAVGVNKVRCILNFSLTRWTGYLSLKHWKNMKVEFSRCMAEGKSLTRANLGHFVTFAAQK